MQTGALSRLAPNTLLALAASGFLHLQGVQVPPDPSTQGRQALPDVRGPRCVGSHSTSCHQLTPREGRGVN